MNLASLTLVLVIGLIFWGSWPLIAKASSTPDPFVRGFLVNVVATISFLPFLRGKLSAELITSRGALILLIAGLFNFAGHALFPKLQTSAGSQVSLYMAIIPALCVLVNVIGGSLFYGEPTTSAKMLFTAFILVGVVGLAFTSMR